MIFGHLTQHLDIAFPHNERPTGEAAKKDTRALVRRIRVGSIKNLWGAPPSARTGSQPGCRCDTTGTAAAGRCHAILISVRAIPIIVDFNCCNVGYLDTLTIGPSVCNRTNDILSVLCAATNWLAITSSKSFV